MSFARTHRHKTTTYNIQGVPDTFEKCCVLNRIAYFVKYRSAIVFSRAGRNPRSPSSSNRVMHSTRKLQRDDDVYLRVLYTIDYKSIKSATIIGYY